MDIWIAKTVYWVLAYSATYIFFRPKALFSWPIFAVEPVWSEGAIAHYKRHYKLFVPFGLGLWVLFFLIALHLKDTLG